MIQEAVDNNDKCPNLDEKFIVYWTQLEPLLKLCNGSVIEVCVHNTMLVFSTLYCKYFMQLSYLLQIHLLANLHFLIFRKHYYFLL